jgi:hypothetical protein
VTMQRNRWLAVTAAVLATAGPATSADPDRALYGSAEFRFIR